MEGDWPDRDRSSEGLAAEPGKQDRKGFRRVRDLSGSEDAPKSHCLSAKDAKPQFDLLEENLPDSVGRKVKELVQSLRKKILVEMLARDTAERQLEERNKEVDSLARVLDALGRELHEKNRQESLIKLHFQQQIKETTLKLSQALESMLKHYQTGMEGRILELEDRFSMIKTSLGVMSLRTSGKNSFSIELREVREKETSELQHLKNECQDSGNRLNLLKCSIQKLRSLLAETSPIQCGNIAQESGSEKNDVDTLTRIPVLLSENHQQIQALKESYDKLSSELQQTSRDLENKNQELVSLNSQLLTQTGVISELQTKLEATNSSYLTQINELSQKNATLTSNLSESGEKLLSVAAELASLRESSSDELSTLKSSLDSKLNSISYLESEVTVLKEKIQGLHGVETELQKTLLNLQQEKLSADERARLEAERFTKEIEVWKVRGTQAEKRVAKVVGGLKDLLKKTKVMKSELAEVRDEVVETEKEVLRSKELWASKGRRVAKKMIKLIEYDLHSKISWMIKYGGLRAAQEERERAEAIELELKEEMLALRQKNLRQGRQMQDLMALLEEKEQKIRDLSQGHPPAQTEDEFLLSHFKNGVGAKKDSLGEKWPRTGTLGRPLLSTTMQQPSAVQPSPGAGIRAQTTETQPSLLRGRVSLPPNSAYLDWRPSPQPPVGTHIQALEQEFQAELDEIVRAK